MSDWTERVDAIRRRREAAGLPIGRPTMQSAIREAVRDLDSPEGTGEDYNPNRAFDYAADIEAHPFRWRPTEPVRVSATVPTMCPCGAPVRTLKPTVQARPRYCAECLTPDGSERCQPTRPGDASSPSATLCARRRSRCQVSPMLSIRSRSRSRRRAGGRTQSARSAKPCGSTARPA